MRRRWLLRLRDWAIAWFALSFAAQLLWLAVPFPPGLFILLGLIVYGAVRWRRSRPRVAKTPSDVAPVKVDLREQQDRYWGR